MDCFVLCILIALLLLTFVSLNVISKNDKQSLGV